MERGTGARDDILQAAVRLAGSEGVCSITTRRIAEEAHVNAAALNYHYGSKENLIEEALDRLLDNVFEDWTRILAIDEMKLPARLYCLLDFTMEGIARYPGVFYSHLFDPLVRERRRAVFAQRMGCFLKEISENLSESIPGDAEGIRLALGQVLITSITAAAVPEVFTEITSDDVRSGPARSRFLRYLLKRLMGIELTVNEMIRSDIARVRSLAFPQDEMRS